jgi:hypothetical protein
MGRRGPEGWLSGAGYPVIIGETGDQSSTGTVGTPFLAALLPWADAHAV